MKYISSVLQIIGSLVIVAGVATINPLIAVILSGAFLVSMKLTHTRLYITPLLLRPIHMLYKTQIIILVSIMLDQLQLLFHQNQPLVEKL